MPEKLLNLEEASRLLGIPEEEIALLVEKGEIPAYKIGGEFLRFRKEQLEAITNEIKLETQSPSVEPPRQHPRHAEERLGESSFFDRVFDFIYFTDFYVISIILIAVMLYLIFRK